MRIAIHQPNFLPFLGFFYKWMMCDLFVFLDDAEMATDRFINRNKIKTPNGEQWITVPIVHNRGQKIYDTEIAPENWKKRIIGSIEHNYSKAEHFDWSFRDIELLIDLGYDKLIDLNINLLEWMGRKLLIAIPSMKSSELDAKDFVSTKKLVRICRELGADEYLSGPTGKDYMDESLFEKEGIKVIYSDFKHPVYQQLWGNFLPNMSIIDLLFNVGPTSRNIIIGGDQ